MSRLGPHVYVNWYKTDKMKMYFKLQQTFEMQFDKIAYKKDLDF